MECAGCLSNIFWLTLSLLYHFSPFYPSFLSHWVFSIKIAVELYHLSFQQQKIVCLDSKMEIQEQGHQGNTNWPRQWNARGIFNFSNLLQTKRLPWSFSTSLSWILWYQKSVDICLALNKVNLMKKSSLVCRAKLQESCHSRDGLVKHF